MGWAERTHLHRAQIAEIVKFDAIILSIQCLDAKLKHAVLWRLVTREALHYGMTRIELAQKMYNILALGAHKTPEAWAAYLKFNAIVKGR